MATISMGIASHTPSDNFGTVGPRRLIKRGERELQKQSSSVTVWDILNSGTSVFPGGPLDHERPAGELSGPVAAKIRDVRGKKILSYEEISQHRIENDAWIVVDGKVYDVTQFLETHPGGAQLLLDQLEAECTKDAGPLMRGKVDKDGHSHSKAAFCMLDQFLVGSVETSPGSVPLEANRGKKYSYDVDLTKPIVAQVGHLGADYDEWVHNPIVCKESPRFFESDICEFLTRTTWWVIPMVWCPVAFAMFYVAMVKENVPLARMPVLFVSGVVIWSFVEYLLHRFVFHMKSSSFWGNTFHYVLHGFHHKHPMDGARLVFPPALTAVICVMTSGGSFLNALTMIWIFTGNWVASYPNKLAIYGSGLLAYVAYDLTHYFLHFGTPFNDRSRNMKRYHLNHHFRDQTSGFGITTVAWDLAFRTLPASKLSLE